MKHSPFHGSYTRRYPHQIPAIGQEWNQPVREHIDQELQCEQAGEEVVKFGEQSVDWILLVDLNINYVDDKILRQCPNSIF